MKNVRSGAVVIEIIDVSASGK
jgi:hypothetical protein